MIKEMAGVSRQLSGNMGNGRKKSSLLLSGRYMVAQISAKKSQEGAILADFGMNFACGTIFEPLTKSKHLTPLRV